MTSSPLRKRELNAVCHLGRLELNIDEIYLLMMVLREARDKEEFLKGHSPRSLYEEVKQLIFKINRHYTDLCGCHPVHNDGPCPFHQRLDREMIFDRNYRE